LRSGVGGIAADQRGEDQARAMILLYRPLSVVAGALVWVLILTVIVCEAVKTGHPFVAATTAALAAVVAWAGLRILVRFTFAWCRLLFGRQP